MVVVILLVVLFLSTTASIALKPTYRGPLAALSWSVGWPAGEMAVTSASATIGADAFLWWWGWPHGAWAVTLVILTTLSLIANVILFSASLYGAVAVRRDLARGLVDLNAWRRPLRYATWWRALLLLPFRPRDVSLTRDLSYGPDPAHRLDVLRSRRTPSDAPVLMYIHGGAWVYGDKATQARPMMYEFVRQGFVVVAINYRHAPRHPWPAQICDVVAARAWVAEHIASFGGNPEQVVVSGGSAGGHLAALLALTANDPTWRPENVDPHRDLRVAGAIPIYGVLEMTGDREVWRGHGKGLRTLLETTVFRRPASEWAPFELASPHHRLSAGAPPMLVVQGLADTLVDPHVASSFVEQYLERVPSGAMWSVGLPLAQHSFDLSLSPRTAATCAAAVAFARWATSDAAPPAIVLSDERLESYAVPPASLVVWHDEQWCEPRTVAALRGSYDVVTAMNPRREGLVGSSAAFNELATQRLHREAEARGWSVSASEGRDPSDPRWNEAGLAIWGLSMAAARDLSERYGQFAWYHVTATDIEVCTSR